MKIRVNGEEYDSWDDVPEGTRRMLGRVMPDADGNGVPDAFEGKAEPGRHTYHKVVVTRPRAQTPGEVPSPRELGMAMIEATTDEVPQDLASDISPLYRPRHAPPDPAPADAPVSPASTVPQGMIMLNGELVNADGTPPKRRWWRRG